MTISSIFFDQIKGSWLPLKIAIITYGYLKLGVRPLIVQVQNLSI